MNIQSLLQVGLYLQVYGVTSGRAVALLAMLLGLIGVIIGRMARARATRHISSGKPMGIVALVLGLTGIVLSVVRLANATGGPGTGNGVVGAVVAVVLGLIGMILGGLALSRSRRMASGSNK